MPRPARVRRWLWCRSRTCRKIPRSSGWTKEAPEQAGVPLLKAAQIYLEQGQPDAAIALAGRVAAPSSGSIRGMALLARNNPEAAEKQFASSRAVLAPILGDYIADQIAALFRLLGASYAGRWQEVSEAWSAIPRQLQPAIALQVGRAQLQHGDLASAEKQLQFVLKANNLWSNQEFIIRHDFLSYALAKFYLGEILEKKGQKAEAINNYQDFLSHFENSSARLPQIAEARAALKRLL
jgi:predicted negative regulator of RcsB-dependent stress response